MLCGYLILYKKNGDKNGDGRIEQGLWEFLPPPIMKG